MGGSTLTVAHALQEVFEGFSQLPRLQDKGQAQGLIGGLGFGEGGGPTHPGPAALFILQELEALVKSLLLSIPRQFHSGQAGDQGPGVAMWGGKVGECVSLPLGGRWVWNGAEKAHGCP